MGRHALLVTTSDYSDPAFTRLESPTSDSEALKEVLENPEHGRYEVEVVADAPYHQIGEAIGDFLSRRSADDICLLYVSCHGIRDQDGDLYFVATNTRLDRLEDTAVAAGRVARQIDRSASKRVLVVLDCCFGGAFTRGFLRPKGAVEVAETVRATLQGEGRAILSATSATEYAYESGHLEAFGARTSVFTDALIRGIESSAADLDGDGVVGLTELFEWLEGEVQEIQRPTLSIIDLRGDLPVAYCKPRAGSSERRQTFLTMLNMAEGLGAFIDDVERFYSAGATDVSGVSTGFRDLDRTTGGLGAGAVWTVAAQHDVYAHSLVRDFARHVSIRAGESCRLIDYKTPSAAELFARLLSAEIGIPLRSTLNGLMSDDEWNVLAREVTHLADAPLEVVTGHVGDFSTVFKGGASSPPSIYCIVGLEDAEWPAFGVDSVLAKLRRVAAAAKPGQATAICSVVFDRAEVWQHAMPGIAQISDVLLTISRRGQNREYGGDVVELDVEVETRSSSTSIVLPFETRYGRFLDPYDSFAYLVREFRPDLVEDYALGDVYSPDFGPKVPTEAERSEAQRQVLNDEVRAQLAEFLRGLGDLVSRTPDGGWFEPGLRQMSDWLMDWRSDPPTAVLDGRALLHLLSSKISESEE